MHNCHTYYFVSLFAEVANQISATDVIVAGEVRPQVAVVG
jgi:hypothetical protein